MNIVIVDDNATNLQLIEGVAERIGGCETHCFDCPDTALQYCGAYLPDLLIVDYMMPTLNGVDLIRAVRTLPDRAEVPILMVTASRDRKVLYAALEAGATDFLTKPLDTLELGARMRNMMAIRRSHLALADRATQLADEVRKATCEILEREKDTILRLSRAAEFRDPETGAHIQRMAHMSRVIAQELTKDKVFAEKILQAAPMHDVGKLGTPDHILLKPGRLTPEEFEIMKRHAEIGWTILRDGASPILVLAAEIARSHHEKFDGSGYPQGLSGDAIPLSGRIVAVADVFDALTSARPYKPAWETGRAIQLIQDGAGSHFDPSCVSAFMARQDEILRIRQQFKDEG